MGKKIGGKKYVKPEEVPKGIKDASDAFRNVLTQDIKEKHDFAKDIDKKGKELQRLNADITNAYSDKSVSRKVRKYVAMQAEKYSHIPGLGGIFGKIYQGFESDSLDEIEGRLRESANTLAEGIRTCENLKEENRLKLEAVAELYGGALDGTVTPYDIEQFIKATSSANIADDISLSKQALIDETGNKSIPNQYLRTLKIVKEGFENQDKLFTNSLVGQYEFHSVLLSDYYAMSQLNNGIKQHLKNISDTYKASKVVLAGPEVIVELLARSTELQLSLFEHINYIRDGVINEEVNQATLDAANAVKAGLDQLYVAANMDIGAGIDPKAKVPTYATEKQ